MIRNYSVSSHSVLALFLLRSPTFVDELFLLVFTQKREKSSKEHRKGTCLSACLPASTAQPTVIGDKKREAEEEESRKEIKRETLMLVVYLSVAVSTVPSEIM